MLDYDTAGTALVLVRLQSNLLSLIAARRFVGVVVARANSDEENTKGRDGGGENSEACLDGGPDHDGRREPCLNLLQVRILVPFRIVSSYK